MTPLPAIQCTLGFITALLAASGGAWALTLVEKSEPKAVLVVPDEQKFISTYAAMEFQYNVKKASGAELPIVTETEAEKIPGGKVFFLLPRAAEALAACLAGPPLFSRDFHSRECS